MWLITTLVAAIIATLLWSLLDKKYKLGFLSLMLWGAAVMILADLILGYEGGQFLEMEITGIIRNRILLGILMLIPVLIIWLAAFFISKQKNRQK